LYSFLTVHLSLSVKFAPVYTHFPGRGVVVGSSFHSVILNEYFDEDTDYKTKLPLENNDVIFWLNEPSDNQELGEISPHYGNEPSLHYVYSHCSLLVSVPPLLHPLRVALMESCSSSSSSS